MELDKEPVSCFEEDNAYKYDSARKGTSALESAEDRSFELELAVASNKVTYQLMWDIKIFFDSVDIGMLIKAAVKYKFPLMQLAMSLLVHTMPLAG